MQVQDIKIINVDNVPYIVESLSPEIRNMVAIYNDWNVETANARNELVKLDIAMKGMAQSIIVAIRAEKEKAVEQAPQPVMPVNGGGPPGSDVIAITEDSLAS